MLEIVNICEIEDLIRFESNQNKMMKKWKNKCVLAKHNNNEIELRCNEKENNVFRILNYTKKTPCHL